jgi:hypothetical protein
MGLLLAPIADGKLEAWKKFIGDMKSGSKKEDFSELNQRYGLTRHDVWMREQITEFHNMNLNEPPPGPPPQKLI